MSDNTKDFQFRKDDKDKAFDIAVMKKYVQTKQELDKLLEVLITPFIQNKSVRILDACCGIGHIIYWLRQISPQSTFAGFDSTPYLIDEAKQLCPYDNVEFKVADVHKLHEVYEPKSFDITINWKTLSWLPRYEPAMKELVQVTRQHIFLSSLFFDGDIDFEIKVREYQSEAGKEGFNAYYNVYSYPRFEDYCYSLGAKAVVPSDFEIGIDLPPPAYNRMGTYTVRLEDGRRLQICGAVVHNWKVIRIDL